MPHFLERKALPLQLTVFSLWLILGALAVGAQEEDVFQPEEEEVGQPDESFTPRRPDLEVFHIDSSDPDQAITIDGFFGEDPWSNAEVASGFTQQEPFDGQPASEKTEVRVLLSDSTLYVGVLAFDSEPEKIIAKEMSRDGSIRRDDGVIIILDTFHDGRNAYYFQTNPNGARTDALVSDEGRQEQPSSGTASGRVGVSQNRTDVGWQTEIAIPLSTLRYDPSALDTWGLQVRRSIQRKRERGGLLGRDTDREPGTSIRISLATGT